MVYDETLGYDDAMPDAFNKWVGSFDSELLDIISNYDPKLSQKIDDTLWEYFSQKVYPYKDDRYEE